MYRFSSQSTFYRRYATGGFFRKLAGSLSIFILGVLICQPAYGLPPKDLKPIIAKLEAQIQDYVKKKRIPGCAIAIVYNNQIFYMNGFGVRTIGKSEKIDVDTVFQLGSVSKPIAATLASILENKGLLRLEDPVNLYLPQFSLNSIQPPSTLKVKHVLSHSTGVPRAGFNQLIEAHTPYSQILKTLKNTPVRAPVGKRYDYNNAMYSVISEITRTATKLSFSEALRINLLQPLSMTRTSATYEGLLSTANRASPHVGGRKGLVPCGIYSSGYYTVAPAGGINSSVRDMAIFLKAQLGGYPQVLNPTAIARIQIPQVTTKTMLQSVDGPSNLTSNARYALGWRTLDFADQKMVYHGGWVKGFTNFIGFIPQQSLGIIVLHNGETKFSSRIAMKFFELYFDIPRKKTRKEMLMPLANKCTAKSKKMKNIKAYRNLRNLKNTKNIGQTKKTIKPVVKPVIKKTPDLKLQITKLNSPKLNNNKLRNPKFNNNVLNNTKINKINNQRNLTKNIPAKPTTQKNNLILQPKNIKSAMKTKSVPVR